jgi:hypothetical protein
MDLIEVHRVVHPATAACHGTFSKTDHILGQKVSLKKYKET